MFLRTHRFNLPSSEALTSFQREMESLFGSVLNDGDNRTSVRGWRTPVAIWNDADKVYVEIELPGVSKDSLDLTVLKGVMRITGERKAPEGDRHYWVNDRQYGAFERTFSLPEDVDADSVDAQLTDGVLRVVVSKHPEAQPKKIAVRG